MDNATASTRLSYEDMVARWEIVTAGYLALSSQRASKELWPTYTTTVTAVLHDGGWSTVAFGDEMARRLETAIPAAPRDIEPVERIALKIACVLSWYEHIDTAMGNGAHAQRATRRHLMRCLCDTLSGAERNLDPAMAEYRDLFDRVLAES